MIVCCVVCCDVLILFDWLYCWGLQVECICASTPVPPVALHIVAALIEIQYCCQCLSWLHYCCVTLHVCITITSLFIHLPDLPVPSQLLVNLPALSQGVTGEEIWFGWIAVDALLVSHKGIQSLELLLSCVLTKREGLLLVPVCQSHFTNK